MVYWIHEAKPKEGAKVILQAGDRPVLVVGTYEEGRVAVFYPIRKGFNRQIYAENKRVFEQQPTR